MTKLLNAAPGVEKRNQIISLDSIKCGKCERPQSRWGQHDSVLHAISCNSTTRPRLFGSHFGVSQKIQCHLARSLLRISDPCSKSSTVLKSEIFIISGSLSLRFVYFCLSTKLKQSTKNGLQFLYSHHF